MADNLTIWQRLTKVFGPDSTLGQQPPVYKFDKKELLNRERYHIEQNLDNVINKRKRPTINEDERKEYQLNYKLNHIEDIKRYTKKK